MVKSQKNLIHRLRQKFKSVDFGCKNRALLPLFGQHKHFFKKKRPLFSVHWILMQKMRKKVMSQSWEKKALQVDLQTGQTDSQTGQTYKQMEGQLNK